MGMTVKYSDPSRPDGERIAVGGVAFVNNEEVEVSDDTIRRYEQRTGRKFDDLVRGKKFGGSGFKTPPQEEQKTEAEGDSQ